MGARRSAGQRRAAKVRARRDRARGPERARERRRQGIPAGRVQPRAHPPHEEPRLPEPRLPDVHPLEVLQGVDPLAPDEDLLLTALQVAVLRTLHTGSTVVGVQVAQRIDQLEAEYGEGVEEEHFDFLDGLTSTGPMDHGWETIAWDVLVTWLRTAGQRPDAAVVAERALRWVEERLGRVGPGLEQQAIHLGGPGAAHPLDLGECLRDDLVAVRIWLVAGLVAVTGSGGPDPLARLTEGGHAGTRAPTRRRGAVSSGDSATARVSAETVGPER